MTPEHDALARQLIALPSWTATGPTISMEHWGKLEAWLHKLQPTHLMVAGNRARNAGIEAAAFELLDPVFARPAA